MGKRGRSNSSVLTPLKSPMQISITVLSLDIEVEIHSYSFQKSGAIQSAYAI